MKISKLLRASLLMAATSALTPASLLSTGRDAARIALTKTKNQVTKANIPAALALAAEKTKEFTTDSLPQAAVDTFQACEASPGTAVACGVAGAGILLVTTPAAVAVPSLAAVGFGSGGIIHGSTAAAIQSGIGNVGVSSLFATLQSAGAGGYGAATVYGAVQVAGGAIITSAMSFIAWTKG